MWDALEGAETALKRLYNLYAGLGAETGEINTKYSLKFKEFVQDDLDTPRALTVLWDVLKDKNISDADKKATILDFDKVLGLGFADFEKTKEIEVPEEVQKLALAREEARRNKDFRKSDGIRKQINSLGYEVKDTSEGQKIYKI